MKKKFLLIGGSGSLGQKIIKSNYFKNLDYPNKKKLNILKKNNIRKILKNNYNVIINCAALARMKECEKNPKKAKLINITGSLNLVNEIKRYNLINKKMIKLIHISTDAVYPSINGNYKESSKLKPYNVYGWSKYISEKIVKKLKNSAIIRTRFFDKKKIKFKTASTDIFTSMIEVEKLVKEIKKIINYNFLGIINVGDKKRSDFENYKKFKKNIKPCKRTDILKDLNFLIAKDASMNLNKLKKLKRRL